MTRSVDTVDQENVNATLTIPMLTGSSRLTR